jgi:hypothetical protein
MTSFMHVFHTNKVPRVAWVFLIAGIHLGIKMSNWAILGRCGRHCTLPRHESK